MDENRLIEVRDLRVHFPVDGGDVKAVDGVSFRLDEGETLALVGESGSGKSQTAHALLRLLPGAARLGGSVRLDGEELLALSPQALLAIRGQRIGMVFQEPMTSLNPLQRIGRQVGDRTLTVTRRGGSSKQVAAPFEAGAVTVPLMVGGT